jgi:peptidoglycan/xylan/chitin deacetylase (PgdA/CDA1 family)
MSRLHLSRLLALLALILSTMFCFAQNSRSVALTFDDLPLAVPGNDQAPGKLAEARRVNTQILKVLAAHHATAIGFVNEIKLNVDGERDARATILRQWLDAGMELGNHTYSHLELSEAATSKYQDDFVRGTTITCAEIQAIGKVEKYFRYPYLDTGKDKAQKEEIVAFYTSRGFVNAPVTVQNQDWMFNVPYVESLGKRDSSSQKRIVQAYLQQTKDVLSYSEVLARQSFGRDIPQVMLLHADALNADQLDAVLTTFEQRNYRFISLHDALSDPAYATPDEYVGPLGISWLDRWQIVLGKPFHPNEPLPPKWAQDDYKRITGQDPF